MGRKLTRLNGSTDSLTRAVSMVRALSMAAAALVFCGCGESNSPAGDAGSDAGAGADVRTADGPRDAPSRDARILDSPADGGGDGGVDARLDPDAGESCTASSCFDFFCGRSACGFPCGRCVGRDNYCSLSGQCVEGVPPGEQCTDAWGEGVVEGASGFRPCPIPGEFQRCTCSGGGADAWVGCEECRPLIDVTSRGGRCRSDSECLGTTCATALGVCGETCDFGAPCTGSSICAVPGDIAGACFAPCDTCGSDECGHGFDCVAAPAGNVCLGAGIRWFGACPD